MGSDRQASAYHARRLDQLADDIAARLRNVCAHMPAEQFAGLVQEIAVVTLKYEEREFGSLTNPPDGRPRNDRP